MRRRPRGRSTAFPLRVFFPLPLLFSPRLLLPVPLLFPVLVLSASVLPTVLVLSASLLPTVLVAGLPAALLAQPSVVTPSAWQPSVVPSTVVAPSGVAPSGVAPAVWPPMAVPPSGVPVVSGGAGYPLVAAVVAPMARAVPGPPDRALARGAPSTVFRWPLDGTPRLVRRFDPPPLPWDRGHRGVDLGAFSGATVRAAGTGVVLFAGMIAGRPVVSVSHPNGLRTTYEPVRPDVSAGDRVDAGDPLGSLLPGHPGCPTGTAACLHWGLRRGEEYLDPLLLLGLGRVRLLPITARIG